jgi:hypothetical protein
MRHKIIPDDLSERWGDLDTVSNFLFTLPNVSKEDWQDMKSRGEILQAKSVLMSGPMNLSVLPLYSRRAIGLAKRAIR